MAAILDPWPLTPGCRPLMPSWRPLKPDWIPLKPGWRPLKPDWRPLKLSWRTLKQSWRPLKPGWRHLKHGWRHLKPDARVTKEFRFNLKEAITRVPNKITEPENVTDIVFQVGFNDVRKSFLSPQEAQEKTLQMQQVYHEHFPNARQHITALPPMNDKLKSTNALLQKLANHTESNFIHTKVFSDRASGNLRANVMEGIHYNDWGVRLLAKEIKKSLYSHANKENNRLTALLKTNPPPQENQTPSAPSPPPLPPPQENQPSSAPPPPPPPPQENQPSSTPSATLDEDYTDLLRQLS